jgi:hypothetical protein
MQWLASQEVANTGTVGYSWTTKHPAKAYPNAPSFPPTDLIFQCYPYYAEGQKIPTEGLGPAGDYNMLLYLEMTGNRPPPKERSLTYTGNWATPSIPASMCISTEVFWNDYLLQDSTMGPLLVLMNQATWVEAVATTADYFKDSYSYTIGAHFGHDSDFWAWTPKSNNLGWTWSQTQQQTAKDHSSPGCEARSLLKSM